MWKVRRSRPLIKKIKTKNKQMKRKRVLMLGNKRISEILFCGVWMLVLCNLAHGDKGIYKEISGIRYIYLYSP